MPDVTTQVKSHNAKILKSVEKENKKRANCRNKELCPLQGNCLTLKHKMQTKGFFQTSVAKFESPRIYMYKIS